MANPFIKNRYIWFIAGVLLAIGIIVFYQSVKYTIIDKKVNNIVASKTNKLYKVSYDSISLNEAAGDLFIYNLKVTGDTILQQAYMQNGDTAAASMLLDILVPVLRIEGFKTAGAVLTKDLSCSAIYINDPRVTVYFFPGVAKPQPIKNQQQALYNQLLGKFNLIQADSISIINAEVVGREFFSRDIKFHTFNTSLRLSDVRIDSSANSDTTRTFFSKEIFVHTDKFRAGDNPALFEATNVTFDTRRKVLDISQLEHNGQASGHRFSGSLSRLAITGLTAEGPVESMEIEIGKIKFASANIIVKGGSREQKTESNSPEKPILSGWVKKFTLETLQSGDINLTLGAGSSKEKETTVRNSNINLSKLVLDTTTMMDKSLLKAADDISLSNQLISLKSEDGLYVYNFRRIGFNKKAATIKISAIEVKPLFGEAAFAKRVGVQKDRFEVNINNVVASKVDVDALVEGRVYAAGVQATNNAIRMYRDNTQPMDSIKKVGRFPHQMIRKLPFPLYIKQLVAAKTFIQYKEKNPLSDTSGSLIFENSTLALTNITNDKDPVNKTMDLDFKGALLGQMPLQLSIKFYLEQIEKGNYQVTGNIQKSFKGEVLNKLTVPVGLVRIDKGTINGLSFNYMADNINAQGTLTIKYNDLKLSLLKKNDSKADFGRKGLLSLLANIVVRNNNPNNNKLRQADVVYKRDEYKSFFNMLWKFVFTGMKDVMGAKF